MFPDGFKKLAPSFERPGNGALLQITTHLGSDGTITIILIPLHLGGRVLEIQHHSFLLRVLEPGHFDFLSASECPAVPKAKWLGAYLFFFFNLNLSGTPHLKMTNTHPPTHTQGTGLLHFPPIYLTCIVYILVKN